MITLHKLGSQRPYSISYGCWISRLFESGESGTGFITKLLMLCWTTSGLSMIVTFRILAELNRRS
jgi:hypothetical protein